jgi:hypothetical protein
MYIPDCICKISCCPRKKKSAKKKKSDNPQENPQIFSQGNLSKGVSLDLDRPPAPSMKQGEKVKKK